MNDLTVFNRGGQLYTDSREVAKLAASGDLQKMKLIHLQIMLTNLQENVLQRLRHAEAV